VKDNSEWWWSCLNKKYGLAWQQAIQDLENNKSNRIPLSGIERAVGRIIFDAVQQGQNTSEIPLSAIIQLSGFSKPTVIRAIYGLENKLEKKRKGEAWIHVDRDRRNRRYYPLVLGNR